MLSFVESSLNQESRALRDAAVSFASDRMAPHAAEWDRDEVLPIDVLREAASLGFGGMYVRSEFGGSELCRRDGALIFEGLSRGCVSTSAYLSIHNMCAWMLDSFGDESQRAEWLPSLCSMERLGAYCLTEPGSGSDAASLRTSARRDGDDYVVNGSKAFISGAGAADVYFCMVRTGGEGSSGISCLAIEKGTSGLSFGSQESKLGWRSQPTAMVMFDECRVPSRNLVGEEGRGFNAAMSGLNGGRLNIASCSIGGASASLEEAFVYMNEREQFGTRLKDFQGLRFRAVDAHTEIEAARLLVLRAAEMVDEDHPDAASAVASAKRYATDAAFRAIDESLQFHGGYAYLSSLPIERRLRDARVHRILEGSNEVMRSIVARRLLDDPAFAA